jgi:excinuclease ABC subunit C
VIDIQKKLAQLPQATGVYLFKDGAGKTLYIGKALSIRDRIAGHWHNQQEAKEAQLWSQARDVEYILTDSEVEALILEAQLVRQAQPKYNILLKDDKKFPWIRVTDEPFPRVFATRSLADDGSRLFGPYTDSRALQRTLRLVKTIFPVRSCTHDLPRQRPQRPCLNHQIGKCHAPCQGKIGQDEYQEMVRGIVRYLTGRSRRLEAELSTKRDGAAAGLRFEEAAHWRDQLENLRAVTAHQKMVLPGGADCDFIALEPHGGRALFSLLHFREGRLAGRSDRAVQVPMAYDPAEALAGFIEQHYFRTTTVPQRIVVAEAPRNAGVLEQWLTRMRGERVSIGPAATPTERKLLALTQRQVRTRIDLEAATQHHLTDRQVEPLAELQRVLGLDALPRSIAAFDISHTGGTESAGSAVRFQDGRPAKKDYRHLRIRNVEGIDDPAMMRETVGRYIEHLREQGCPLPDLLVVDGGLPQLNATLDLLHKIDVKVPAAGLAKRLEELHRADGRVVSLGRHTAGLRLLQRLRDEAHRFARRYHHALRKRDVIGTRLTSIQGLGEKRARLLLQRFGSVKQVTKASPAELAEVLGSKLAERIRPQLAALAVEQ